MIFFFRVRPCHVCLCNPEHSTIAGNDEMVDKKEYRSLFVFVFFFHLQWLFCSYRIPRIVLILHRGGDRAAVQNRHDAFLTYAGTACLIWPQQNRRRRNFFCFFGCIRTCLFLSRLTRRLAHTFRTRSSSMWSCRCWLRFRHSTVRVTLQPRRWFLQSSFTRFNAFNSKAAL